ncbi:MAG: zinc ribbon domain-containing protein [Ruminococcus sp.]|nr:zinc ribbon domain-containing protein [Ruminococcus sp.]
MIRCEKCAKELRDNAKFCKYCGARVETAAATEQVSQEINFSAVEIWQGAPAEISYPADELTAVGGEAAVQTPKKKSHKTLIIVIVILLILSVVAAVAMPTLLKKKKSETKTFNFEEFSMKLPSDMEEGDNHFSKADYQLNADGGFLMFNAYVWDDASGHTTEDYIDNYIDQHKRDGKWEQFYKDEDELTCNTYGSDGSIYCYTEVKCFIENGRCVLVEVQCASDECKNTYENKIGTWFDSFRMK